jgi:hypothetical protein
MSRRNSVRKRLQHHRATVDAEKARTERRATLQLRRTVKAEASKLAGEMARVVSLEPRSAPSTTRDTAADSGLSKSLEMMAVDTKRTGRIRKMNADRRKTAVRRKKIEARMRERLARDVDMLEEEEVVPMQKLALVQRGGSSAASKEGESTVPDKPDLGATPSRAQDALNRGVRRVRIAKKSAAKVRREERKRKLQALMRDSILMSDTAKPVQ